MSGSDSIKLCECGCGLPAPIAQYSNAARGYVRGKPRRFIAGHNARVSRPRNHGTHGMTGTPEFKAWETMRDRCRNPRNKSWRHYGGRGISVCESWQQFENFYADMGPRPTDDHSLDRIDVNGHYEPANCRWALESEQKNNRRDNIFVTNNGRTLTLSQWARELGLPPQLLIQRYSRGMRPPKLLSQRLYRR